MRNPVRPPCETATAVRFRGAWKDVNSTVESLHLKRAGISAKGPEPTTTARKLARRRITGAKDANWLFSMDTPRTHVDTSLRIVRG
jgi:hypothetical protein